MPEKFDPYYRWLGIPSKEQPPHHYRLLGIELFEADPQLIDSFALRHTDFLREITDGPHLPDAQRLLNELAAARRCLLDPQRKAAYDAELRQRLAAADKPATTAASPVEPAAAVGQIAPPGSVPMIAVAARHESRPATDRFTPRRPRRSRPPVGLLAAAAVVTLAVLGVTAAVLMRSGSRRPAGPTVRADRSAERASPAQPSTAQARPTETSAPESRPEPVGEPAQAGDSVQENAKPEALHGEAAPPVSTVPPPQAAAAEGLFIPEGQAPRLAGLALWFDAAMLPSGSGRITRWSDGGGGGYVAQPKPASQPPEILAHGLSGKPVARFRGLGCLEIPGTSQALNLGADYTIAYMARGVAGTLLSKGSGDKTGQFSLLYDSCFLTNGEANATSGGRLAASGDDSTQFRVRTISADAAELNWFIDGLPSGSFPGDRHEIQNKTVLRIGSAAFRSGQEAAAGFFVGDLAELLIYKRALPEDERQRVEAYLRDKWLAGDSPPAPLDLVAPPPAPAAAQVPSADATPADPAAPPAAESPLAETGQIRREVWRDFKGFDLDAVQQLWRERPEPNLTETTNCLAAPADFDDNYCQRLRGFLQPPVTGDYAFTIRANEDGVLLLSTDERPENKRPVNAGDRIPLSAGRAYYVEAIHWEKSGKDHFSVGWRLPGGKEENPIPGERLSLRDRPPAPHEIGFVALTPLRAEASRGSPLRVLDDGTILAENAAPGAEVYSLTFEISLPAITAIELRAVPHESLPGGGPGLGSGGSFRLAEVEIGIAPAGSNDAPRPARLREVLTADGDAGAARLIDGNTTTLWSCRRGGQPVSLTFLPNGPIRVAGPAVLHVTLHNRDQLGCFRVLATSQPEPPTPAPTAKASPEPADSGLFRLFVNVGGGPWQDPAGNAWVASKDYDGATFGHEAGQVVTSDAVEHPVYSTAVRKLTGFRAAVPNGEYAVELHFQEHWSKNPADRAFVVTIEQQPVLRPPLFFQGPGMGQPYVHTIPRIIVKDGRLDVDFSPVQPDSLTILNGIVIRQLR